MCFVEPISIALLQFVQRKVPAETSLPAGTGFAMKLPPWFVEVTDGIPQKRSLETTLSNRERFLSRRGLERSCGTLVAGGAKSVELS
jgi:hypothetical protein